MKREELIDLIVANVKTDKWINSTFEVEGKSTGVKAFGHWAQRVQVFNMYETAQGKTNKEFKADVARALDAVLR